MDGGLGHDVSSIWHDFATYVFECFEQSGQFFFGQITFGDLTLALARL